MVPGPRTPGCRPVHGVRGGLPHRDRPAAPFPGKLQVKTFHSTPRPGVKVMDERDPVTPPEKPQEQQESDGFLSWSAGPPATVAITELGHPWLLTLI